MQQSEGEIITIIGPKNSGKTTYLAGLADWPEQMIQSRKNTLFTVEPINKDAKKLKQEAQEKIREGVYLEPTELLPNSTVNDLPYYFLKIKINRLLREEIIRLVVRDYPGEIYKKLAEKNLSPLEQGYIKECLKPDVVGCLILLDQWEKENDLTYISAMLKFLEEMNKQDRIKGNKSTIKPLRIAVAISKCERGEIWPCRLDPETDIFNTHLPGMTRLLRDKLKNNVRFFAISTFGVLKHNDPRPNRKGEKKKDPDGKGEKESSVLREPDDWYPYGMIAPLYWLSKGKAIKHGV